MRAGQRWGVSATETRGLGLKGRAALVLFSVLSLPHSKSQSLHQPILPVYGGHGLSVCQAAMPPPSSNNTSVFLQWTSSPHHQLSKINSFLSLNFRERLMTQPWPMRKSPSQALVVASKVNEHVVQGRQIRISLGISEGKRNFLLVCKS